MTTSSPLAQALQSVLDGDYQAIRNEARAFISRPEMSPPQHGTPKETHRAKTLGWVKDMVAAGYTRLPYDTQYGGAGKYAEYMNFVEMLGHQDMSLAIKQGVQFGLFGLGLYSLGTAKHHAKYMNDLMNGKLLGGFAMTEVAGGSDVQGVQTTAVYDPQSRSFTLHTPDDASRKAFIGNAALHGEMMVVFAQLHPAPDAPSEGVHAFVVPVRDKNGRTLPGIAIHDCGQKAGLNGVDNGYIAFDNVKLPYDALLDRFAQIDTHGTYQSPIAKKTARFFTMISTLVTGRIFISALSVSGAKNALINGVRFAENRTVFGDNLLDKQATQTRLMPHIAETYALHFATRYLQAAQAGNDPALETIAAAIKSRAADSGVKIADDMRTLCGGAGYMSDMRFDALRGDMDIFRTFEGDNTVLRLLVAKNRLGVLSASFNKAAGFAKIKKAAHMAFRQRTLAFTAGRGATSPDILLDPAAQLKMFTLREDVMLQELAQKFRALGKKHGFAAAANMVQDDMTAYSEAYAEKIMMTAFIRNVDKTPDATAKAALKDLCDVYALSTLRKNAAWYLERKIITPAKSRAMTALEKTMNAKTRALARDYVDGFGVPEAVLFAAPRSRPAVKAPQPKAG